VHLNRAIFGRGTWLRAAVAALLVFAYALIALPAQVHRHAGCGSAPSGAASAVAVTDADHHAAPAAISSADCALCDFAAALVSPAVSVEPPAAVPHLVEAPAPSMPLRARPYIPFRFCDRCSSRAPPAATLAA
jgi:hypothetical protein